MRKRFSIETIHKRRREAEGIGRNYQPFLRVQDFPSKGKSSRILGETTGRKHELFSQMERSCFLIFDHDPTIIDIREQFPLFELSETLQIAEMLGVRHPREPQSQYPTIMTTDFLLTRETEGKIVELARAVKTREDFNKKRTREKLQIERVYWQRRRVDWKIILEESINRDLVKNLESLRMLREQDQQIPEQMRQLKERILNAEKQSVREILEDFEAQNGLKSGRGLFVLKHLIRKGELDWDLSRRFSLEESYQ